MLGEPLAQRSVGGRREGPMGAAVKLIASDVGDGGVNHKLDVKALQQLLVAAGENIRGGVDGKWGPATRDALNSFQTKGGYPVENLVKPADDLLLHMAEEANILIPLPRACGWVGVKKLHEWFKDKGIRYNSGAEDGGGDRAIYGIAGHPDYAIQQIDMAYRAGPVEMDCTTYVNLMLALYRYGSVHAPPYDANCSMYGDLSEKHCSRDRYGLPLVRRTIQSAPP